MLHVSTEDAPLNALHQTKKVEHAMVSAAPVAHRVMRELSLGLGDTVVLQGSIQPECGVAAKHTTRGTAVYSM